MGDIYKYMEDIQEFNEGKTERGFGEEVTKNRCIDASSVEDAAMTLLKQGWKWLDVVKVLGRE